MSDTLRINRTPTFTETAISIHLNNNNNNIENINKFVIPKRKNISTSTISFFDMKKVRKDVFGEEIKRGGKHRISFKDKIIIDDFNEDKISNNENIENNKNIKPDIVEVIDIVSYKKDTKQMVYKSKDKIEENICCESCNII